MINPNEPTQEKVLYEELAQLLVTEDRYLKPEKLGWGGEIVVRGFTTKTDRTALSTEYSDLPETARVYQFPEATDGNSAA